MAVIGIDLGTTYSAAAQTVNGKPEIIPLEGEPTLPSVVGLQRSGKIAVGKTAKNNQAKHPQDTIIEVKRKMGENVDVRLGDKAFKPQEISAMILKKIKEEAENELGEKITGAVISCPAYFKDPARQATKEAGELAGLKVLRIINEPTAAAYAYGVRGDKQNGTDANQQEQLYLVYDLGGGTFDVTVIKMNAGSLDVIGTVQDELKRPVGSVRETVKLSLDASQEVKRKNVQYTTGFVLGPGKYHFKFVVRENESGRIGSFETDFTIPDIRKAPLKMSSVVLASQRKDNSKKGQNPLVRDGSEIIPNIAHVFTPDQHLFFFYEVYEPAKDKSPAPVAAPADDKSAAKEKSPTIKNPIHLLTSIQFFNGKIKAFETPLIEARQLNAPERKAAVFQFDIPLSQIKPGFYTCQVSVIDDAGGNFSFPRLPLLVREKPNPSPASAAAGGTN